MKNEQSNMYTGLVNNEMNELDTNLNTLKQVRTTTYVVIYLKRILKYVMLHNYKHS